MLRLASPAPGAGVPELAEEDGALGTHGVYHELPRPNVLCCPDPGDVPERRRLLVRLRRCDASALGDEEEEAV